MARLSNSADDREQRIVLKACPVVIRSKHGRTEVLAFKHPQAGNQLVKGTIETTERPEEAALRELAEESGLTQAVVQRKLGVFDVGPPPQHWHAFVCTAHNLPDQWVFETADDGGHAFEFFWHSLDRSPDSSWHLIFRQALDRIRAALADR